MCGGTSVMKAERLWWRCKMSHFAGGYIRIPHTPISQSPSPEPLVAPSHPTHTPRLTFLLADHSRSRIQNMSKKRPNGAYGTVQPLNHAAERERFLSEARDYEETLTRTQPPADPQFTYADMDKCDVACPSKACTCARGRLWHEFGTPSSAMLPEVCLLSLLSRHLAPLTRIWTHEYRAK